MDLPRIQHPNGTSRIVSPTATDPHELFDWITATQGGLKIILPKSVAKSIRDHFPINSKFKELQSSESHQIRTIDIDAVTPMVLTSEMFAIGVQFGEIRKFTEIADTDLRQQFGATFDDFFDQADPLAIDVSPWNELLDSLEEMVGKETRREYVRLIDSAMENDIHSLDEISVAIIATALAGGLQNDLGKWGEENDFASAASFSRRKNALEDDGVITTEKVPIDVGRPKLRLKLSDRVGGLTMDIGVGSQDIDGSTPVEPEDSSELDQSPSTSDEPDTEPSESTTGEESDVVAQLNEEIEAILSSN